MSLSLRAALMAVALTLSLSTPYADIIDRMREPVIVRTDPSLFPRWVGQGIPTANFELWTYRDSSWEVVPFQIDDVSDDPEDVKRHIDDPQDARTDCIVDNTGELPDPTLFLGPCEFHYDLRNGRTNRYPDQE